MRLLILKSQDSEWQRHIPNSTASFKCTTHVPWLQTWSRKTNSFLQERRRWDSPVRLSISGREWCPAVSRKCFARAAWIAMHRDIDNILDWGVLLIGHLGHAAYEVNLVVHEHDRPPTGGRRVRRSKSGDRKLEGQEGYRTACWIAGHLGRAPQSFHIG